MAKARLFDLPETKGAFQLRGIVSGTQKDGFFKEIKTKTNKEMRIANFGLEYEPKSTLYVTLQGNEQEYAFFSKKSDKPGEKNDTVKVPWADRLTYDREGYKLIGKNIGVKKKVDESGKVVNDKKVLTDFDACNEVKQNLQDGNSVFVRGSLSFSSYVDNKGNKRASVKLSPNQISLCADIDFENEQFEKKNDFNQVIIFMGIEKERDDKDKETGRFVVQAKIVTYSTIEDAEFIIEDSKLANVFKKNLKPYYAIKVSGHMVASAQVEIVEEDDEWGESDAMEKVSAPIKREFIITGAKPSTIDKEVYAEEKVMAAMAKINNANKAENDFGAGASDGWGNSNDIEDEEEAW